MAQKTSSLICLQVSAVQIIGPPTAFHSDSFVTRFWCRMCRKRPQCGTSSPKWTTASITEQLFFFFFFSWQFGKLLLPANMMALTSGLNQPRRAPKRPVPWHCTKLLIWKAFLFHPVWGKISENELWPLLLGAIIFTKKLPTQWSNYCVSSSYLSLKVHKRVSHLERVLNA